MIPDLSMTLLAAGLSEGSASLLRDFAVALVVAAVGLSLARLVRQPPVLGYLLAGMLIGPFTLPTPLISNQDTIGLLAELGLILLLFGIGLELGWRRIRGIGVQVLVIGVVEISVLTLLGIWVVSILPGIDAGLAPYLGGALAISSSAILLKGLRDGGNLNTRWGQTIIGILLVEDFAAVILLTVLAGLASTGAANLAEAGLLVLKLGVFCIVVLVIGTLLAPKLMRVLSRFQWDETLLLASLGMCFLMALCATLLGLSPAAGAFMIGVVIGDTEASERITRMVSPVRDMFSALFFLSIGMLIDYRTLDDYIVPALVVVAVFMTGKIIANTVGSILAGRSPEDSLKVGMTMPQMGEFSLAIGRLSPADIVGSAALGPILSISTVITTALAPLTSRTVSPLSAWIGRRAPGALHQIMLSIRLGVDIFWSVLSLPARTGDQFRGAIRRILINISIIGILSATGTGILSLAPETLRELLRLPSGVIGLGVAGVVIGLSIPSAVRIWRSLNDLALLAISTPGYWPVGAEWIARQRVLRTLVEYGLALVLVVLLFLVILPLVIRLLTLGSSSILVSLILLMIPALAVGIFSFRIHRMLELAVRDTFMNRPEDSPSPGDIDTSESGSVDEDGLPSRTHPEHDDDSLESMVNPLISSAIEHMPERDELSELMEEVEPGEEDDGASTEHENEGDSDDNR